jgi:hypothetical protein
MIMDANEDIHWRRMESVTCFMMWRERCARIFRDQGKTHIAIMREIILEFKQWFEA